MIDVIGEKTTRAGRATSLAALGGVIGPVLFVILVVVAGAAYDGYSHVTQKISELGGEGAEYAILQNVNFAIVGALVLGFSWALARTIGPPYLGPALVGYFGLVLVAHAWVPCDLGCRGETTIGLVHNVTGLSAFIASIVGMLLLARRWREDLALPRRLHPGCRLSRVRRSRLVRDHPGRRHRGIRRHRPTNIRRRTAPVDRRHGMETAPSSRHVTNRRRGWSRNRSIGGDSDMGQPRTERPLTKKLGALSGAVTVVAFVGIHDIWITDIWSNLGPMVFSGALCGLVIVWSYNTAVSDHSARRWFAYNGLNVGVLAALGALSLIVLEPRFTTAETQLMDDAMGELMPPALPLMVAVIPMGTWLLWALYGRRRSAVVPILLTQTLLVFLLGHQLAFLGLVQMSGNLVTVFAEFIGLAAFLGFAFAAIPILMTRARARAGSRM